MPPCINPTISIIRNLQHNFPKMRGRGVEGRMEFFRKFIQFGSAMRPTQSRGQRREAGDWEHPKKYPLELYSGHSIRSGCLCWPKAVFGLVLKKSQVFMFWLIIGFAIIIRMIECSIGSSQKGSWGMKTLLAWGFFNGFDFFHWSDKWLTPGGSDRTNPLQLSHLPVTAWISKE